VQFNQVVSREGVINWTPRSTDYCLTELTRLEEKKSMEAIGLLVTLEARAGKEADAEAFLKSAQPLALNEKGTLKWYAFKLGPGKFGIFDTFANEAGRNAHLNGDIAKALGARADELFAVPPQVEKVEILANTPFKG
jgi:quinol monooxygenase YgiN